MKFGTQLISALYSEQEPSIHSFAHGAEVGKAGRLRSVSRLAQPSATNFAFVPVMTSGKLTECVLHPVGRAFCSVVCGLPKIPIALAT
jgi:hypothetical protein